MTPLATYISELVKWQSAVTPETGHYPTLNTLLSQIGQTLSPKVIPAAHPIHFSPKTPDFGLFSDSQARDQMPWVMAKAAASALFATASFPSILLT